MATEQLAATRVRRILAVFFILDVALTAFLGLSLGRWITRIRVARSDGGRPGLVAALIRTAVPFLTGWFGLVVFTWSAWLSMGKLRRMWWDAAAGTSLISARKKDEITAPAA